MPSFADTAWVSKHFHSVNVDGTGVNYFAKNIPFEIFLLLKIHIAII